MTRDPAHKEQVHMTLMLAMAKIVEKNGAQLSYVEAWRGGAAQ